MGTVDCDLETDHLQKLNLESDIRITIGDNVEADRLKDVVNSGATIMYPEMKEIHNDLEKTDEKSVSDIQCKDSVEKERNVNHKAEGSELDKSVDDLIEVLSKSKLNPMAREFVPRKFLQQKPGKTLCANVRSGDGTTWGWKRRNPNSKQKRQANSRTSLAQCEERIKRTVYVSDIDQRITEDFLALLFSKCGQIVDCRICMDPNSIHHIAFIEFTEEVGAITAIVSMSGFLVGFYPIKVQPSKTAIAPVNPTYLPHSDIEREICNRTIYCKDIDKKVTQPNLKNFFQSLCGKVSQVKLVGDCNHPTRIAFVEFVSAESAIAALRWSGIKLRSSHIRISPSKTPIQNHAPCRSKH